MYRYKWSHDPKFGFQRSFSLLCFRQTQLVWPGPRKEFGDLVPGHNNRQTTLFPHFLQLVIRSCLARWWSDGDHGMLTLLEHGRMPRPKEGAELVPVVATWEHATEGEDHKKQQRSSQGKPQRRPWGAALARTRDDEKWTDLHGQVGKTVRGTGQCCGPHASAGSSSSACLTLISLSVFTKKKLLNHIKYTFGGWEERYPRRWHIHSSG